MQRPTVNYFTDALTLLVLLAIAGTGMIMKFALPPGSGGRGLVLWGLGRHDWGGVHFWLTVSMGVLLTLHIVLHWTWVCTMTWRLLHPRSRVRPPAARHRNALGIIVLAGIVGGSIGFALLTRSLVRSDEAAVERHENAERPGAERARRGGD